MKITVVGTGYVGLVTGVILAEIGHNVICFDIDKNKVNKLKKGICPIYEKDLENLILKNKSRLSYTNDQSVAYKDAEVIVVGVGTPENEDGTINLDYINSVCKQIAESVEKDCVVVIKSTVSIGVNDSIESYLKANVREGINIHVASNPEFLSQGTAVHDSLYASRIVIGVESKEAESILHKMYEPLTLEPYNVPIMITDRKSAEMIKYASNNFLALKLSYINEIANLCEKVGANIKDLSKGMGYDSRIGNKFLNAGIGYGGSCFPKDTNALYYFAKENNVELNIIKTCIEVNNKQKVKMFEKLLDDFDDIKDKKIAVLGLTFKEGTDDIREAPSIYNIKLLLEYGAIVKAYDPIGIDNFKETIKNKISNTDNLKNISYYNNIDDTVNDCDAVMILTEWPEIREYNISKYEQLMKTPQIYDGRNCYDLKSIENHNIHYISIGRKEIINK